MEKDIIKILHKYCSGSIDESGSCYIHSKYFNQLTNEIVKLIERRKRVCRKKTKKYILSQ